MRLSVLDSIDFSRMTYNQDLKVSKHNMIIIKLHSLPNNGSDIVHTQPAIDRCCKPSKNKKELVFHGKDEIPRINCNYAKTEFVKNYIRRRRPVILEGCQDSWPARNWTFKGNASV